ncbi:MAG: class I SAM-dependent methyltransferase [Dehalococcoidia bacterium]
MAKGNRLFAALYDPLSASGEKKVLGRHRPFMAGQAKGRVMEIGIGTGANLPYYPKDINLVAIEPNPHMLRRARTKAKKLGISVAFLESGTEELPFPDQSFDTVVSSLVFCSVTEPVRAMQEVYRVLAPGGEYRFLEHVRAYSRMWARFQDLAVPVSKLFFAGCHPNRDTVKTMADAGLEVVELKPFDFGLYPYRPHVLGVARRPQ